MTEKTTRCSKCILSSAFPKIQFDEDGVCNFCRNEIYYTTESKSIANAHEQVKTLLKEHKGKGQYDAIMCYSGGKDSTYTLMLATQQYKLKVLALTVDNGFLSPAAFDNINQTVDKLGVDLVTVRPSSKFFVPLIKASAFNEIYNPKTLTRISSICNSCISIINIAALKLALEKKVPFILAGFTLGQIPANSILYKNNYTFFQESREPMLNKLRDLIGNEVDDYFCIDKSLLESTDFYPYNINLLCLDDPSEEQILADIKKIGWTNPKDVDGCSSNCRLNGFNNFVHKETMGFNPYELELSHLIRRGKLSRDEALKKVSAQSDMAALQPTLKQLGISQEEIKQLSSYKG